MSTDIEIGQEKNSKLSCVFSSLFVMAFAAEVDVSLFRMEKRQSIQKTHVYISISRCLKVNKAKKG